jgi:hypothetical protein
MAGHPLNYEPYPEVMPQGGPEARQTIHADPDMFGATIGRGMQTLGQGIEKADDAGFDYATMVARQDDHTHSNEVNAWFAKQGTNVSEKMTSLRGKAAAEFLPDFQNQIDGLRKQALGQAGNPYTKQLIDDSTRQLTDQFYRAGARHAGEQKAVWDQNTAVDSATAHGNVAVLAAGTTPGFASVNSNPSVVTNLDRSDDFARQAANYKGLDGDTEVGRNRGVNVKNVVGDGKLPLHLAEVRSTPRAMGL